MPLPTMNFDEIVSEVNADQELTNKIQLGAKYLDIMVLDHIPFNGDDEIVIIWEKPNQVYGESFTTKYFFMDEPGLLQWGHDKDVITLEYITT